MFTLPVVPKLYFNSCIKFFVKRACINCIFKSCGLKFIKMKKNNWIVLRLYSEIYLKINIVLYFNSNIIYTCIYKFFFMLAHKLLTLIMHALCFCHCFVILSVLCFIISLLFYNKFLSCGLFHFDNWIPNGLLIYLDLWPQWWPTHLLVPCFCYISK